MTHKHFDSVQFLHNIHWHCETSFFLCFQGLWRQSWTVEQKLTLWEQDISSELRARNIIFLCNWHSPLSFRWQADLEQESPLDQIKSNRKLRRGWGTWLFCWVILIIRSLTYYSRTIGVLLNYPSPENLLRVRRFEPMLGRELNALLRPQGEIRLFTRELIRACCPFQFGYVHPRWNSKGAVKLDYFSSCSISVYNSSAYPEELFSSLPLKSVNLFCSQAFIISFKSLKLKRTEELYMLHRADLGLILGTPNNPPNTARSDPWTHKHEYAMSTVVYSPPHPKKKSLGLWLQITLPLWFIFLRSL